MKPHKDWLADDGNVYPVSSLIADKLDAVFGDVWPTLAQTHLIIFLLHQRADGMRGVALDRHTRFKAWLMGCSGVDVRRAREHVMRLDNCPRLRIRPEINAHLSACDDIVNMNNAIVVLERRDFREMFDTIDQVHGNSQMLACGCVLQHFFDHHQRDKPDRVGNYWHYPLATCDRHAHLADDYIAHYAAAITEEMERNRVRWRRLGLRVISSLGQTVQDKTLRALGIRTNIQRLAA